LGAKFFSHRTPGQTPGAGGRVPFPETGLAELDHQQTLVLGALRRAAGAPVSYAELRAAGVELPASVVSELELAGMAIERCSGEGRGVVAVRLDPADDPAVTRTPDTALLPTTKSNPGAHHRATGRARANVSSRVLALTTLVPGIAVAASFVAIWAPGGGSGTRAPSATRPLLATGETPGGCREPASSTCLTYAYALYDLGRAVRLSGAPRAAVPILERRLQIDNQRSIVGAELQLARQGIG
jgi:hypothetical protein